jgi:hypothetical protein
VTRNHAWLKRRTAALNLRNLLGKGLARRNGAWVLATWSALAGNRPAPAKACRAADPARADGWDSRYHKRQELTGGLAVAKA